MSRQEVTVKIAELKESFFVREKLNQDWAIDIGLGLKASVKYPAILVAGPGPSHMEIIDGRHRKEGHILADMIEINCVFVDGINTEAELIAAAFRANLKATLPMSIGDRKHTIRALLRNKVKKSEIPALLGLPVGVARDYINKVQEELTQAKIREAVKSVIEEGLTVATASEKHAVSVDRVKEAIAGVKQRTKKGIPQAKRELSALYRSLGLRQAKILRDVTVDFIDGNASQDQVGEIFDHVAHLHQQAGWTLNNRRKRFEAENAAAK